jgi:uncharacterized repeat protein (TIGR04138 family)
MQQVHFEQAVEAILEREKRFDPGAYFFLKEALDFTVKRVMDDNAGQPRHVSGPELLQGFRDYALQQFGPMASTLMTEWGLGCCADVGEMVFQLIEEGVFGRQESDTKEDFHDVFDFDDAFVAPFLPKTARELAS